MCTTSAFEWLCPTWRLGWPIRLFPYILHCPLCTRLTIDSRNWHFYGETMGSRGWTEKKRGIERGEASGDAHVETRESQFDVNRSIVIRVNRLLLYRSSTAPDGLPNTIHDLYCILFPEWSRNTTVATCCERLQLSIMYKKLRLSRITDNKI